MIGLLLKELFGIGAGYLEGRRKLKEVKVEAETRVLVARAEAEVARLSKAQDAEIAWDNTAVSQMDRSWKDEYLTLLLSAPIILAFLGDWGRKAAADGFAAISNVPEWYMVAFMASIAASFGVRALVDRFGLGKR
ncbi:hypothetical protein UFOVP344_17 [uncultured Caudovirales phage]|uniref:Holin of 3TMs, for gene-transfer release n=1 Tax=uncultured Caudovirales phage TaxID=2100421 RepID=A0A6J5LW83_9CAUD|nr:hypothetical protein UFOVP344_17 [uncultured Caudovirales phage]